MVSHSNEATGPGPLRSSSETAIPRATGEFDEKVIGPQHRENYTKHEDDYSGLKYPEPWKFEKFFVGGYSHKRMIKFKNPKTMYKAINLFAGMSYGSLESLSDRLTLVPFRYCYHVLRI